MRRDDLSWSGGLSRGVFWSNALLHGAPDSGVYESGELSRCSRLLWTGIRKGYTCMESGRFGYVFACDGFQNLASRWAVRCITHMLIDGCLDRELIR